MAAQGREMDGGNKSRTRQTIGQNCVEGSQSKLEKGIEPLGAENIHFGRGPMAATGWVARASSKRHTPYTTNTGFPYQQWPDALREMMPQQIWTGGEAICKLLFLSQTRAWEVSHGVAPRANRNLPNDFFLNTPAASVVFRPTPRHGPRL